jgi:hypothetical protein
MTKVKTTVKSKDNGFSKLVASLGELGEITLGVHKQEADRRYLGSDKTVGQIATIHELGLGVPRRRWLGDWLDANIAKMKRDTTTRLRRVLKGTETRTKALQELGFKWAKALRDNMAQGRITPKLAKSTIAKKKGFDVPLVESYMLHNNLTYRAKLKQARSIKNLRQRAVVGRK